MKPSEKLASKYLSSLGLSPIVYEPDGNVPPDFLVEGRIAVEVRRLNYNAFDDSGYSCGVETAQFALLKGFRSLLPTLGPPIAGKSWFVHFRFSRPLPSFEKVKRAVKDVLEAFKDGRIEGREFSVTHHFKIDVIPSSEVFPDCFVLGGFADHDTGGWLIGELEKNIQICIQEKSGKIAKVRAKYAEWWLVLVDHIGYGQRETLHVEHDWDKVVLVNPHDPENGYEI